MKHDALRISCDHSLVASPKLCCTEGVVPLYTSMYSISLHRIRSIKRCLTPYALPVSCLCSIILRAQQLKYRRMIGRISNASPKHRLHIANCRQFSFGGAFRQPKLNFHSSGPWICATLNGKSHRDVCMTIRAWFSRTSNLTFEGVCHFLVWLTIEPFRIPRRRLVLADHLLKKPFIIQRKSLQGMRKSLVEPYSENQNTNHTSMRWSTWSTYLSALFVIKLRSTHRFKRKQKSNARIDSYMSYSHLFSLILYMQHAYISHIIHDTL